MGSLSSLSLIHISGEAAVYTFTNTVAPFRIKVRKIWEDKGFEEFRPEEIKIQILRKAVGEPDSAYRPVAEDFDGNPLTESIDENGYFILSTNCLLYTS